MVLTGNARKAALLYLLRRRRTRNRRRWGIRPIFRRRKRLGEFHTLINEMYHEDSDSFFRYFRMLPAKFDELLSIVSPLLVQQKRSNRGRKPISHREMLAVTLRYLSTGDSQSTISFSFRLGHSTVNKIIYSTCKAVYLALQPTYLPKPTHSDYKQIAKDFWQKWQMPNCCGSIDGKHCVIVAPPLAGSGFYNYKGSNSIVLLAVSDANLCFVEVDVGQPGRMSDGGIFRMSEIGQALASGTTPLPDEKRLPGSTILCPHFIIGDAAFPLRPNVMRPFPGVDIDYTKNVFNYRLSRARRTVENCFGVLSARFRVFRRPIAALPENVDAIIYATVVLHNFLMKSAGPNRSRYCPPEFVDRIVDGQLQPGDWREIVASDNGLRPVTNTGSNNYSVKAETIRNNLAAYFRTPEGSVPWQDDMVQQGRKRKIANP